MPPTELHRVADFCRISTGYTVRVRLEPEEERGVLAIQLRDVPDRGQIDPGSLRRFQLSDVPDHFLVGSGDVIFRSRGERNTACVVGNNVTEPIVAILPLMILRPDRSRALPDYLAWAINQPDAQRQLDTLARGTDLRMIPKSALEDVRLPIPDLGLQQRIVTLNNLAAREQYLLRELADRREQLLTSVLTQWATGREATTEQGELDVQSSS